jgi:hypothetical protein
MSQPGYVSGVWLSSRLGVSQHQFRQLVNRGDFPPPDLTLGKKTRLWRLLPLAERFPGLADGTTFNDERPTVNAERLTVIDQR